MNHKKFEKFLPDSEKEKEEKKEGVFEKRNEKELEKLESEKIEQNEEFKKAEREETKELEKIRAEMKEYLEEKRRKEKEEEEEKKKEVIRKMLKREVPKEMEELIGDNSDSAWEKRENLFLKDPQGVIKTLAGITSERAKEFFEKHKIVETQKLWRASCLGLINNDSEWAWEMRKKLLRQKERKEIIENKPVKTINWFHKIIKKITGERPDEPTAWRWQVFLQKTGLYKSELFYKFRKIIDNMKFSPGWFLPGDVVISTTGLDSEKAWELRKQFLDKSPAEVLISLRGNNSKEANEIRKKFQNDKRLKWALEESLKGLE